MTPYQTFVAFSFFSNLLQMVGTPKCYSVFFPPPPLIPESPLPPDIISPPHPGRLGRIICNIRVFLYCFFLAHRLKSISLLGPNVYSSAHDIEVSVFRTADFVFFLFFFFDETCFPARCILFSCESPFFFFKPLFSRFPSHIDLTPGEYSPLKPPTGLMEFTELESLLLRLPPTHPCEELLFD